MRTAEEYNNAHLKNAVNMNVNDDSFEKRLQALDKSKLTFVYCLSGAHSEKAAEYMRSHGFAKVYELQGGILKWNKANKPVANNTLEKPGMSAEEFDKLIMNDRIVVVDFFATWCALCKKTSPILEQLSMEMKDKIELVKINVDENKTLVSLKNMEGIPVI